MNMNKHRPADLIILLLSMYSVVFSTTFHPGVKYQFAMNIPSVEASLVTALIVGALPFQLRWGRNHLAVRCLLSFPAVISQWGFFSSSLAENNRVIGPIAAIMFSAGIVLYFRLFSDAEKDAEINAAAQTQPDSAFYLLNLLTSDIANITVDAKLRTSFRMGFSHPLIRIYPIKSLKHDPRVYQVTSNDEAESFVIGFSLTGFEFIICGRGAREQDLGERLLKLAPRLYSLQIAAARKQSLSKTELLSLKVSDGFFDIDETVNRQFLDEVQRTLGLRWRDHLKMVTEIRDDSQVGQSRRPTLAPPPQKGNKHPG